jgi:hypothetical protein
MPEAPVNEHGYPERVNARSGFPGSALEWTRQPRMPFAHSALRSAGSGLASLARIRAITRLRVSFDRKSVISLEWRFGFGAYHPRFGQARAVTLSPAVVAAS